MAQQVGVGGQPDAGGEAGEGAAGVVGVDLRGRSVRNTKSSWTGWGGRPGSTLRSVTVWGCPRGLARNQLGLSLRVAAINLRRLVTMGLDHGDAGWTLA